MSEFVVNADMFGLYAMIPYGHFYHETGETHIYKIVNRHQSNTWCEVPLTYQTETNPKRHDTIEDVLNVIHCGIDERKVITVAMKDCEIIGKKVIE